MLSDADAQNCGGQLLGALERIQARHGWSDGDLIADCTVTLTQLLAQAVGPTRTVGFFRDHAESLDAEHARRATT